MATFPYNLSAGDTDLLTKPIQLQDDSATFQIWYNGITATTVKIEAYISTDPNMPFALVDDATLTINKDRATDFITLTTFGSVYVQFKLVTGGASAGTITKINLQK